MKFLAFLIISFGNTHVFSVKAKEPPQTGDFSLSANSLGASVAAAPETWFESGGIYAGTTIVLRILSTFHCRRKLLGLSRAAALDFQSGSDDLCVRTDENL